MAFCCCVIAAKIHLFFDIAKFLSLFPSFYLSQLQIKFQEAGHAPALGEALDGEAEGLHHGAVVVLMGAAQFGGMILYYMFSFTTHSPFVFDPFLSMCPFAFRRESSR